MIKFESSAEIPMEVQAAVDKIPIGLREKRWDGKAKDVLAFKGAVMTQGLKIQSYKCAWCTLDVRERGRRSAHRDHIAPKSKHPRWTFTAKNLVISCEYCNGFTIKGDIETIEVLNDEYEKCTFLVVHPYLDEVEKHISLLQSSDKSGVLIESHSTKGTWTIKTFNLDSPDATALRAKDLLYRQHMAGLTPQQQTLVQAAVNNLGGS